MVPVPLMPTLGPLLEQLSGSWIFVPLRLNAMGEPRCLGAIRFVPVSASIAYTVLFSVVTYTTVCTPLPGMLTPDTTSGCVSTWSSSGMVWIHPNEFGATLAGVRIVSCEFQPVLCASLW